MRNIREKSNITIAIKVFCILCASIIFSLTVVYIFIMLNHAIHVNNCSYSYIYTLIQNHAIFIPKAKDIITIIIAKIIS